MSRTGVQGRVLTTAAALAAAATIACVPAPPAEAAGGPFLERARAVHPTFFHRGAFGCGFRFAVEHPRGRQVEVKVRLYRGEVEDGRLMHTWDLGWVEAGSRQTLNWHGALPGRWAWQGRYMLEVRARDRRGRRLDTESRERSRTRVRFYRHAFPVRGRHDLGENGSAFGARRGRLVVAARRGRVVWNEQGSAAGNYMVMRGDDGHDYAYMHMREPSRHEVGDMVRTGARIGRVGCTGSCSYPHLHFEMWTPHWWEGGEPFDPLRYLRRWDRWS